MRWYLAVFLILVCRPAFTDNAPALEDDMGLIDSISGRGMFRSYSRLTGLPTLTYSGWYAAQGNPGSTNFNLLSSSATLFQSDRNLISAYLLGSDFHINSPPQLPSGAMVPGDLGRLEFGARYSHKLSDQSSIGGGAAFGSASDQPFQSADVDTYSLNAFYNFSTSEHSSWVISLLYSNNNPISNYAPIPGFMYIYRTETFIGMFGFPFASILWRPADPWTLAASVFGPTGSLEVAYGHRRNFQTFVGIRAMEQSYLRAHRDDDSDRITEAEDRAYTGIRFPIYEDFIVEIQGGYAFNRFIGESDDTHLADFLSPENSADLGNSWYGSTTARVSF